MADNVEKTEDGDRPKRRWKPEYTERYRDSRRERYRTDPEYKASVMKSARERYNKTNGAALVESLQRLRDNLEKIETFGTVRKIYVGFAQVGEFLCFNDKEMALIMGLNPQSFQRMVQDTRWPQPIFSSRVGKTKMGVFSLEEVKALIAVYIEHFETSAHYYQAHVETKQKLYDAVTDARNETELGRWTLENSKNPS